MIATVEFTNPVTKQRVVVFASQVYGITYMPTNACTVLTGPGGAAIPVDCTIDEATTKIKAAIMLQANKGTTDGV